jgi:uncharacterized Zn finger protein (UPF0148 family)
MSFEQLKNIIKLNKEREESLYEDEDLVNNQCPYDYWPLDVNSKGERSCPICGRIWRI